MPPTQVTDGTFSFWEGMDLSRSAYEIGKRQYANGVNLQVTPVGDNIAPRPGWHWQEIRFSSPKEQEYFEVGNVQGGGWYFDGNNDCIALSVSGRIFYLKPISQGLWRATCVNLGNPNNPTQQKVWSCRIPGNRIILSDGLALPYVLGLNGDVYRPDPSQGEMSVCQAMAYVQNRLWWVNSTGNLLYGSDLVNPLSIQEAIDTNIFGFVPGDNRETITAVGQQRYINRDLNGGELVFSTENNVYAVNVPASVPREQWGQGEVGVVRLVIPDSGATSPFSFTSYNTNLFYRTKSQGVANYRQTQTQWANNDELVSNAVEVNYYYDADTVWMLDQCWSVNYKGRLLTTVSPRLSKSPSGRYVYWGGLISMNPAPYYGSQRIPRRFEGLWTGVRPWCLLHQTGSIERLFTVSYDQDGKNRLYQMADKDRYDIGPDNKRKDITCIIETRSFAFDTLQNMKVIQARFYSLDKLTTDVRVMGYSRATLKGPWTPFWNITHRVPRCCNDPSGSSGSCKPWYSIVPESRMDFYISGELECNKRNQFMQYRFEFTGDFELACLGVVANIDTEDTYVVCAEPEPRAQTETPCNLKFFTDYIVTRLTPTESNARLPLYSSNSNSSSCGC